MRRSLYCALTCFILVSTCLSAEGNVKETTTLEFYDGITVTAMKQASGNFVALVSAPDESTGRTKVHARYDLKKAAKRGVWRVWEPGGGSPIESVIEYSQGEFGGQLDTILEAHTVESIALSALWLYEDHLAEQPLTLKHTKSAGSCTPQPNGCSGWGVPNSCLGGPVIMSACNSHDECYQCGAECNGSTRASCDQAFRQDIIGLGGSSACANIFYLGVRALGWLFFDDPNARPYMGPDVYSLGIEISACEGQYAHFCTTYVM